MSTPDRAVLLGWLLGNRSMKRTYRFIEPIGTVTCVVDEAPVDVPVFGGILKHPTIEQLCELLTEPVVVRRYTCEALRKAPWHALRRFPRSLLVEFLPLAGIPDGRRRALELLLGLSDHTAERESRASAPRE
jgi:hypothetical protein